MKSYLLAKKENISFGREPGFGEDPDRKPTPSFHYIAHCLAPSIADLCAWLIDLNQWFLSGSLDPKTKPKLDTKPQPDKTPVHFNADICRPPREIVDALILIHSRISSQQRSDKSMGFTKLPINLSEDSPHLGKYSLKEAPAALEQINTARPDLFLWQADVTLLNKRNLIAALRAIAVDANAALDVPDHEPLREQKKKFDHKLEKRLKDAGGMHHFTCSLHTTAADFPKDLNKIADAIERGEIGAESPLFNWSFCYPAR